MGQENPVPRRINKVEDAAGEALLSDGPGAIETWGAPPRVGLDNAPEVPTTREAVYSQLTLSGRLLQLIR